MYIVIYGMLYKLFKTKKEAIQFTSQISGFSNVGIYKLQGVTNENT